MNTQEIYERMIAEMPEGLDRQVMEVLSFAIEPVKAPVQMELGA